MANSFAAPFILEMGLVNEWLKSAAAIKANKKAQAALAAKMRTLCMIASRKPTIGECISKTQTILSPPRS